MAPQFISGPSRKKNNFLSNYLFNSTLPISRILQNFCGIFFLCSNYSGYFNLVSQKVVENSKKYVENITQLF